MGYIQKTVRGHDFFEVSSSFQKAVRRADARAAGYWMMELYESGFRDYVWRRIFTISAEDVWGIITYEVVALHSAWKETMKSKTKGQGRIFAAKAVILLCMARKSRDADHLINIVYNHKDETLKEMTVAEIEAMLEDARKHPEPIPAYAKDVHTRAGRKGGATREDFLRDEHEALKPRELGLFDGIVPKKKSSR